MGFKHLHEANPFKKNFLIKTSIIFLILTLISCYISFFYSSQEVYDFVYKGKEFKVIVEEGEDPVKQAIKRVSYSIYGTKPIKITKEDLIKRSNFSFFLKLEFSWLGIIIVWIIARFFNRLLYGDDPDITMGI